MDVPPTIGLPPLFGRLLNTIGSSRGAAVTTISTFKVCLGVLPCHDNDIRTTYLMELHAPAYFAAREYFLLPDPELVCNCAVDVALS